MIKTLLSIFSQDQAATNLYVVHYMMFIEVPLYYPKWLFNLIMVTTLNELRYLPNKRFACFNFEPWKQAVASHSLVKTVGLINDKTQAYNKLDKSCRMWC